MNEFDRDACTRFVLDKAREICTFGQRPPGSAAEQRAQELVRDELAGFCDVPPVMEPFQVAQKAFMGQHRVCGVLMLLAAIGYWISPWCAAPFSLLAFVVIIQEVLRYKLFIDPFFPKQTSFNVYGRVAPSGPLRRRVVLNGHPDGAYEWFFLYNYPKIFPVFVITSLVGMLAKIVIDLAFLIFSEGWHCGYTGTWYYVGLFQLVLLPSCVIGILFSDFRHVSPGANDNLTGTLISLGIAKYLRAAGLRLENTELVVLITGSEEAGLRGAKAFAAAHPDFANDVETIFITLDTMRDLDHFAVYNRDLNGTVAHDPAVCKLVKNAGAACGRDLPYASVFLGSSDATAFTQAGWRAVNVAAMDPAPADYYHNRRDTPDNMSPECIRFTIDVALAAVLDYDKNGLPAA